MKKILNDPRNYVDEMLAGLCAAHPESYKQTGPAGRVIMRPDAPLPGKVGIVTGGGSGHLPVFTGYVGDGLLDAAAIGDVFASPTAEQMAHAMQAVDSGAGVLRLYGNYGGDIMNFDMAGDLAEMEGVNSTSVLVADDVASAPAQEREKRRGTGGLIYAYTIAGAAAARQLPLSQVTRLAQKAADACRSFGVALSPCTVPQAGTPTFAIGEDEMEMGMGIHGEPGVWRGALQSADAIAADILQRLLTDLPQEKGSRISVLVNSLGATPAEELYIVYRYLKQQLTDAGIASVMPMVGRYATSMEMTGMTVTIYALDNELEPLLKAPCGCPFWTVT